MALGLFFEEAFSGSTSPKPDSGRPSLVPELHSSDAWMTGPCRVAPEPLAGSKSEERPKWAVPCSVATPDQRPLLQQFRFVEVPGNHYVHMMEPHLVASIISPFLQGKPLTLAKL